MCARCSKDIMGGGNSLSYAEFISVDIDISPSTKILNFLIKLFY